MYLHFLRAFFYLSDIPFSRKIPTVKKLNMITICKCAVINIIIYSPGWYCFSACFKISSL